MTFAKGCTSAGLRSASPCRLDRRKHARRCERDLRHPDADRVLDRIGDCSGDPKHAAFANALCAERTGAALLEDERLVAFRQVAREWNPIGQRRRVRRLAAVVPQLLEETLA